MAGLICARYLHQAGVAVLLLEASDRIGGRVRTDEVNGFLLDYGFQVLLTAYPEAKAQLDYEALQLHPFYDGALVHFDGRFHRLADPFRHPLDTPGTLLSPIGTFTDKLRIAKVRNTVNRGALDTVFEREETTTLDALRHRYEFSENMIDRFFRPFFGGVFFDASLQVSSRMFEFAFRMFSRGHTALPAEGMRAIPQQVARDLPADAIRLNCRVASVSSGGVVLSSGESIRAEVVVVATAAPDAAPLLNALDPPLATEGNGCTCFYYTAEEAPQEDPILMLNGDTGGLLNNVCVPSAVAPGYAPEGKTLISATLLNHYGEDHEALEARVRRELAEWFGAKVGTWTFLRSYDVPYALPAQHPRFFATDKPQVRLRKGRYLCGDHVFSGSLNGAMRSGRHAAEAILADFG